MKIEKFHFLEESSYYTGKSENLAAITHVLIYQYEEKLPDGKFLFGYIHIPLKNELDYKWELKIGSYGKEKWRNIDEVITDLHKAPEWFLELHRQAFDEVEKTRRIRRLFKNDVHHS